MTRAAGTRKRAGAWPRPRELIILSALLALGAAASAGLPHGAAATGVVQRLNASYDLTRELYERLNAAFAGVFDQLHAHWS